MNETLPPIESCTQGNCVFHFPQFTRFNPDAFLVDLQQAIKRNEEAGEADENTPYFKEAVKLLESEGVTGKRAEDEFYHLSFNAKPNIIKACAIAGERYGLQLFLTKRGGIAIFCPCCR